MTKKKETVEPEQPESEYEVIVESEPVEEPAPPEPEKEAARVKAVNTLVSYTPRAGATFFLDLLAANGSVGLSGIRTNSLYFGYGDGLSMLTEPQVDSWFADHRGNSPLLTVKTDWNYLDHLDSKNPGLALSILLRFDTFIHVVRNDVVAQAVSWYLATKTGQYHSLDKPKVAPDDVAYDDLEIASRVAQIQAHNTRWTNWYALGGISPLIVEYETLVAAPADTLKTVFDFLGLDAPKEIRPGLITKLNYRPDFVETYKRLHGAG